MNRAVRIASISFTFGAAVCIEEAGLSEGEILRDRRNISSGDETSASLLRRCLSGADEDRYDGWRDYVAAVVAAADLENNNSGSGG